uniref:Uncharacterized protein n=1 Tax=Lactuca sativa TaxID=4236 RepID=A0A9R1W7E5_LACSA|nr:hypothetical protein LSAT_V11C300110980 [Lactuca sativa]
MNINSRWRVFKCEGSLILPKAFHYQESRNRFYSRRRLRIISNSSNENFDSNVKKAKLSARKKDRVNIPSYNDLHGRGKKIYPIREFLSHPSGIEALLNTQALQKFEQLDLTTYRCTLPQLNLLNFEVSPVIDLRVTPTTEDCMVELLCCKFEGSEVVTQQNEHFSAEMTNYITWCTKNSEPYLDVDVTLDLTLEIYTQPFTMLPTSAVENDASFSRQTCTLVTPTVDTRLRQMAANTESRIQLHHVKFSITTVFS